MMAAQEASAYEKEGGRGERNRVNKRNTSSTHNRMNQGNYEQSERYVSSRNSGWNNEGRFQPQNTRGGRGYYQRNHRDSDYDTDRRRNQGGYDYGCGDYQSDGGIFPGYGYWNEQVYPADQHEDRRWYGQAGGGGSHWRRDNSHQPQRGRGRGRGKGRGREGYASRGSDRSSEDGGDFEGRMDGRRHSDTSSEGGRGMNRSRGGGRQRGRGRENREQDRAYQKDDNRENFSHQDRSQQRKPKQYNDRGNYGTTQDIRSDVDKVMSAIQGTQWQDEEENHHQNKAQSKRDLTNPDSSRRDVSKKQVGSNQRSRGGGQGNKQHQKGTRKTTQKRPAARSGNAETQTGSLIEQLTAGSYECLVCCDRIKCEARVWSCKTCFVVFHLGCIKKWAKTPAASVEGTDGWQCPACRGVEIKIPHVYYCFCGKSREPPWEPGETPHSCGEVCRRKRPTSCPHPCNILCHPGPCPPCPSNVQKQCNCGKTQQTVRCGTQNEIRCQEKCGKSLNCGLHSCEEICHGGPCSPCEETIVQVCYCGEAKREVACDQEAVAVGTTGSYSCMAVCGRTLECGHHECETPCHPGDCKPCSRDPARITHCPCGKTPLSSLGGVHRTSCTDPIPTCDNKCGKSFTCGGNENHVCEQPCHSGPCSPCKKTTNTKCRCGYRFIDVPCKDIQESMKSRGTMPEVICDRKCPKKKHCGRHKCGQICCTDSDHLCLQQCGRKLKCGIHLCEEPCHMGNCPPCLHASFDELTCHCGTEVLFPPIPCGTLPPECRQPCNRRHSCEHPVRHLCHSEEKCPPCVELISKTCIGGHEVRYNIPCHVQGISCGRPCGKPLPCGYHNCLKTCHSGDCDPECKQPCKVTRPDCGHPCNVTCHVGWPCPQITCKAKVTVKCPCGRRAQVMECQASGNDGINKAMQKLTVSKLAGKIQTLQRNEEVDISELTGAKGFNKTSRLLCDEECALQERNRRLADALQIKNPELSKSTSYGDFLKEQAKKHPGFVAAIEKELAALVVSAQSSKQASRSHAFPSMIKNHRRIIHELAEFYGCESESYDEEPKRNVVTTARKNRCFMPSMTLTATIQRGLNPRAPIPIPHHSQEDDIRSAAKAVKLSTNVVSSSSKSKERVIDYFDMTG